MKYTKMLLLYKDKQKIGELSMNYKQFAEEHFSDDIYAVETTGVKVEDAGVDYARCSLKIDRRHFNVDGNVMGGAIFTLADYTFGIAANICKAQTVSLSATINFIRATKGPVLYAEARCIKSGKSIGFFEITVTDDIGNTIAMVLSNGFRKQ